MKPLTILFLFFSTIICSQNSFRKASLLTKDNVKIMGYVKTFGAELPNDLVFKKDLSTNAYEILNTNNFKELKVGNSKFILGKVSFETLNPKMMAQKEHNTKSFNLTEKECLLKVILETDQISLLSYNENNNEYFFIKNGNTFEFLRYKVILANTKKIEIKHYRNQLAKNYAKNVKGKEKIFSKIKYDFNSLKNFFERYAKSNNLSIKKHNYSFDRNFKNIFNLTPKLGYSQLNQSYVADTNSQFFKKTNNSSFAFNAGIDLEYFFNTIEKKSSLVFSYKYYVNTNIEDDFSTDNSNGYSRIDDEFQINTFGLNYRHYFKFGKKNYFYADAGLTFNKTKGNVNFFPLANNPNSLNLNYSPSSQMAFNCSLGCVILDNLYLEINYIPSLNGKLNSEVLFGAPSSGNEGRLIRFEEDNKRDNIFNLSLGYSIF
ncbi:hypothetical protein [Polaribacter sp. R77954]|uniref:hypothetical protein n=1 Tax=Polaribacter sp. R77954 TaxID=3093870 RepID=UPI0037CB7563